MRLNCKCWIVHQWVSHFKEWVCQFTNYSQGCIFRRSSSRNRWLIRERGRGRWGGSLLTCLFSTRKYFFEHCCVKYVTVTFMNSEKQRVVLQLEAEISKTFSVNSSFRPFPLILELFQCQSKLSLLLCTKITFHCSWARRQSNIILIRFDFALEAIAIHNVLIELLLRRDLLGLAVLERPLLQLLEASLARVNRSTNSTVVALIAKKARARIRSVSEPFFWLLLVFSAAVSFLSLSVLASFCSFIPSLLPPFCFPLPFLFLPFANHSVEHVVFLHLRSSAKTTSKGVHAIDVRNEQI